MWPAKKPESTMPMFIPVPEYPAAYANSAPIDSIPLSRRNSGVRQLAGSPARPGSPAYVVIGGGAVDSCASAVPASASAPSAPSSDAFARVLANTQATPPTIDFPPALNQFTACSPCQAGNVTRRTSSGRGGDALELVLLQQLLLLILRELGDRLDLGEERAVADDRVRQDLAAEVEAGDVGAGRGALLGRGDLVALGELEGAAALDLRLAGEPLRLADADRDRVAGVAGDVQEGRAEVVDHRHGVAAVLAAVEEVHDLIARVQRSGEGRGAADHVRGAPDLLEADVVQEGLDLHRRRVAHVA